MKVDYHSISFGPIPSSASISNRLAYEGLLLICAPTKLGLTAKGILSWALVISRSFLDLISLSIKHRLNILAKRNYFLSNDYFKSVLLYTKLSLKKFRNIFIRKVSNLYEKVYCTIEELLDERYCKEQRIQLQSC